MKAPLGAKLINSLILNKTSINKRTFYQYFTLGLTFFVYFVYHLTRRPISIVKPELYNENCTEEAIEDNIVEHLNNSNSNDTTWCDWRPFDTPDAKYYLGLLDTSYLITYALFMFVAGYVAERSNLRYFLSISLVICGIFAILFGIAYDFEIHVFWYYIIIQILSGIAQTSGWPAVVATIGNWFGSSKKGLIFGIWNSHTSLGNIAGAAIAGAFVETNWSLCFIVPGLISCLTGVIVFLFLIPSPPDVGLVSVTDTKKDEESDLNVITEGHSAISFLGALKIPGVVEFSICLFFAKLVSYTFLYWLPLYITESTKSQPAESAYLSISFDIGGVAGAITAGYIADTTGASALTCITMLIIAIPSLFMYYLFGTKTTVLNQLLQFIAGMFVNGPYSLITTAVSTELATKVTSKSAMATVSAIIDGTGSIGAAIGPLLAGVVDKWGWEYVFYMVMLSDFLAVISLLRIGFNDYKRLKDRFLGCHQTNNSRKC